MRHQLSGRQLSRNAPHRWAMLRNMAASLLRHETIRTTVPKAKELRRVVEPLITLGKDDSDANRRRAFAQLRDAEVVVKLFESLGPRFKARPGGYTQILRMDPRPGDSAPMALMRLMDQPEATAESTAPASAEGESLNERMIHCSLGTRNSSARITAIISQLTTMRTRSATKAMGSAADDGAGVDIDATSGFVSNINTPFIE